MVPDICGLGIKYMKAKKKYILILAIISIIIHTIAILYSVKVSFYYSLILLISEFSFLCFGILYYFCIKKEITLFFKDIIHKMDCMINREEIQIGNNIDDTLFSQTYHRLERLYGILLAKQKELEVEKNKLQSFISDISHQIRTPITNLNLVQEILLQSEISHNKQQEYLKIQKTQIDKLDFLIQSLTKASQLENGIINLNIENTSINDTIIYALESILIPAEKKHINIVFDNSKEYFCLHDKKWTCEAIFNILDNAVKYTPPYGNIKISLTKLPSYVNLSIQDTGIGIPENELNNIFKRFWRGNSSLPGNGIGLYLCKRIVALQKGSISVVSRAQNGTQFNLYLPL